MTAGSIRARVRAEMTDEIKAAARRHLAVDGANLSLRAVARDVGMASSAVYRYFASRDELLTALIIDAYDALGDGALKAEGTVDRDDLTGRWFAICHAVRDWALAQPHEYALIYGSPVPGYAAPQRTVAPGIRVGLLIAALVRDAYADGRIDVGEPITGPLAVELAELATQVTPGAPEQLVARGLTAWIQLLGAVSFELFGQLDMINERREFFAHQMTGVARHLGLPA